MAEIVVKQAKRQEDTWYDEWDRLRFLKNWLLTALARCYWGRLSAAFLIMEDLVEQGTLWAFGSQRRRKYKK